MDKNVLMQELQEIFRDVLDMDNLEIGASTSADDIEDWDSLSHINLVVAIEKKYSMKFALGELEGLKNVGDMVDLIIKKNNA